MEVVYQTYKEELPEYMAGYTGHIPTVQKEEFINALNDAITSFGAPEEQTEEYIELINSEEKKSFRIIVFNTNDSNIRCNYFIASGYANNKLDDIEIPDHYKEVAIKFSVFNRFKYKDSSLDYKLLSINDNNTLDIISMEAIESNNLITGSLGYLNLEEELNTNVNIPNTRIVTISDIEKYTNQSIVEINAKDYKRDIVFYISLEILLRFLVFLMESLPISLLEIRL